MLIIRLMLIAFPFISSAQKIRLDSEKITKVPLIRVNSSQPFAIVSNSTNILLDQNSFLGLPDTLVRYVIRSLSTLDEQELDERYQHGEISVQAWRKKRTKIDSTKLRKHPFNHTIVALVGITRSQKKVVVVDQNNNHDFRDDRVLFYPIPTEIPRDKGRYLTPISTYKYRLPTVSVRTEVIDKGSIHSVSWLVRPNPYNRVELYTDTTLADVHLDYQSCTHFEGEIYLKGKKCRFAVTNNNVSPVFPVEHVEIKVATSNEIFTMDDDVKPAYHIGQSFFLGNQAYEFINISYLGDTLYLANKGFFAKEIGNRPNQFSPNFNLIDLNGASIGLSDLKGNYTILDFWGSWCAPCIELLPDLVLFSKRYSSHKNVRLISIAKEYSLQLNVLKKLIKKNHMTWSQVAETPSTKLFNRIVDVFQVTTFPTTILISPEGQILYRGSGKRSLEQLNTILDKKLLYSKK